jgi:hypothetical protein
MIVEKREGEDAKAMRPVCILRIAGLLYAMHPPQITQETLQQSYRAICHYDTRKAS